jgi:hypothetical protein
MIARVVKEEARLAATDLGSVRRLTMGSAPQTHALWDKARAAFPGVRLVMGYGTTEHGPSTFGAHPDGLPTPDLALGYPLPGNEVRLNGGTSPDEGVLEVRCPAVMEGYANLPEVTERVLRDGWYWTGDVARRDRDGFYFFVGRADDMFVCSGENIYPGEVEALLERHPAVHQASVVPVADEERGHIPVAFIVLRPGLEASEAEIKQFALANAPPVQHPRRVSFKPELPLTGTSKIDRRALAEEAAGDRFYGFGSAFMNTWRRPIHSIAASADRAGSDTSWAPICAAVSAVLSCSALAGAASRLCTTMATPVTGSSAFGAARRIWFPSICQPTMISGVAMPLPNSALSSTNGWTVIATCSPCLPDNAWMIAWRCASLTVRAAPSSGTLPTSSSFAMTICGSRRLCRMRVMTSANWPPNASVTPPTHAISTLPSGCAISGAEVRAQPTGSSARAAMGSARTPNRSATTSRFIRDAIMKIDTALCGDLA